MNEIKQPGDYRVIICPPSKEDVLRIMEESSRHNQSKETLERWLKTMPFPHLEGKFPLIIPNENKFYESITKNGRFIVDKQSHIEIEFYKLVNLDKEIRNAKYNLDILLQQKTTGAQGMLVRKIAEETVKKTFELISTGKLNIGSLNWIYNAYAHYQLEMGGFEIPPIGGSGEIFAKLTNHSRDGD